jgi:hypothetical protein
VAVRSPWAATAVTRSACSKGGAEGAGGGDVQEPGLRTNDPPVGASPFVTYEGLPGDFYLKLVGHAARMLRGQAAVTDEPPR